MKLLNRIVEDYVIRSPLAVALGQSSRKKKIKLLRSLLPSSGQIKILDVGTGFEYSGINAKNFLFVELENEPCIRLVGLGIDHLASVKATYPRADFVVASGGKIPFGDNTFDFAHSNAVIEHIIGVAERRALIAEMLRVARKIFVSTPNKAFPIEVHTHLPFLHWLPASWHNRILHLLGLDRYSRGEYFVPLSAGDLRALFPPDSNVKILRPGFLKMNLVAIAEQVRVPR